MTRLAISLFFFVILLSRLGVLLVYTEGYEPFFQYCGSINTKDKNLQSNLNNLFSNLTSEARISGNGYASKSINAGMQNQYNGLIMYYIDSSEEHCLDCLDTSIINATVICPGSSTAAFTYSWCFLRYSDANFINTVSFDKYPNFYRSQDIVSDSSTLNVTVPALLSSLKPEAKSSRSLYAYGNTTDPGMNQTVYGLLQCTRDLEPDNCGLCLQSAIGNLTDGLTARPSKGVRLSFPNCYIRFEFYPLPLLSFNSPAPAPAPAREPSPPAPVQEQSPPPPSTPSDTGPGGPISKGVVALISAFGALLLILLAGICFWKMRQTKQIDANEQGASIETSRVEEDISLEGSIEIRVFLLAELKSATYNFSEDFKLGGGGFGPVYKGTMHDGKVIAAKRLAGYSKQGYVEFKTEVELLAKLKHKNLVKLLGYCIEKNEKLLCYEYLPCGSLDVILFAKDKIKQEKLNWQTRYKIIEGISSGLQYLHIESGLKIIHRDLKPSNILLDEYLNPKISDFGLARLYEDDQTHKETSKIAGTYGYMAPEYAMHGMYSEKLDVYSFGVMILEIVTGRKNSSFCNNQLAFNLISHAWHHWENGEVEQLKDPALDDDQCPNHQLSRCIHIALICVQESPINRPSMDVVNYMLRNESIVIPDLPKSRSRPELLLTQFSMSSITGSSTDRTRSDEASSGDTVGAKSTQDNNIIDILPR